MEYRFSSVVLHGSIRGIEPPVGWLESLLDLSLPARDRGPMLAVAISLGCRPAGLAQAERVAAALLSASEIERNEFRLVTSLGMLEAASRLTNTSAETLCTVHRRASIQCDWLGRIPAAFDHLEQAKNFADRWDNVAMQARLLSDQGVLELYHRSPETALASFLKAADIAHSAPAPEIEAMAVGNAGIASRHLSRIEDAIGYIHQSEQLYKRIGDMGGVASKMSERANLLLELREIERALDVAEQSIEIRELLNDRQELALGWGVKADILSGMGRLDEARTWFVRAGQVFAELASQRDAAMTHFKLGQLAISKGDPEVAERELSRAKQLSRHTGAMGLVQATSAELARLRMLEGRFQEARDGLVDAIGPDGRAYRPGDQAFVLCCDAWISYFMGDTARARRLLILAEKGFNPEANMGLAASTKAAMAMLDSADGNLDSARCHAISALEYFNTEDPSLILEHLACLCVLATVEAKSGNLTEARALVIEGENRSKHTKEQGWRMMPLHLELLERLRSSIREHQL